MDRYLRWPPAGRSHRIRPAWEEGKRGSSMKRSRVRPRLAALLIAVCSCVGLVSLSIAPAWAAGTVTTFPVPSTPFFITSGPDGSLWFTLGETGQIGRITTSGTITEFSVSTGHGSPAASSGPVGITAGPDGNLWFAEHNAGKIGRITTSGSITEFPLPTGATAPQFITVGPDGNLWFTDAGQIDRKSVV